MSSSAQRVTPWASPAHFEALHRESEDPWGVRSCWYEARKRALVMAALPRSRYTRAFEPGCSVGGNTEALAQRCDRLWATDASPAAIARARERLGAQPNAKLEVERFPQWWPAGTVDLLVVAELAYYLLPPELECFLQEAPVHLAPGGNLLLCHWRAQIADAPGHGDALHDAARRQWCEAPAGRALQQVGAWHDDDMRIDVYQRGGTVSVGQAGGAQETSQLQAGPVPKVDGHTA